MNSISFRLNFALVVIAVLLISISTVTIWVAWQTRASTQELTETSLPNAISSLNMVDELGRIIHSLSTFQDELAELDQLRDENASQKEILEHDKQRLTETLAGLQSAQTKLVETEKLSFHYQPKVNLIDRSVVGAEALIRWHHDKLGDISPATFVPVAESAGLSFELDMFVFKTVCQVLEKHPELPEIAVNLSPLTLNRPELMETLDQIVERYGVDRSRIALEITEGSVVQGSAAKERLTLLSKQQWSLHMDDFGTGYSSFGYLLDLPVSTVKIDRIFTWGLAERQQSDELLSGMVSMLKGLGKRVIIEGIETEAQVQVALAAGLSTAQGFLFYKPMPLDEYVQQL